MVPARSRRVLHAGLVPRDCSWQLCAPAATCLRKTLNAVAASGATQLARGRACPLSIIERACPVLPGTSTTTSRSSNTIASAKVGCAYTLSCAKWVPESDTSCCLSNSPRTYTRQYFVPGKQFVGIVCIGQARLVGYSPMRASRLLLVVAALAVPAAQARCTLWARLWARSGCIHVHSSFHGCVLAAPCERAAFAVRINMLVRKSPSRSGVEGPWHCCSITRRPPGAVIGLEAHLVVCSL
jgi:hypothetical protein